MKTMGRVATFLWYEGKRGKNEERILILKTENYKEGINPIRTNVFDYYIFMFYKKNNKYKNIVVV
jgi:hypothetical protein